MEAKPQAVWGTGAPQRGPGRSPIRGSGDEVPQKLKNFKSSHKQILRIFGGIYNTIRYIEYYRARLYKINYAGTLTQH